MTVLGVRAAGGLRDTEAAWWQGTTVSISTKRQQMTTINSNVISFHARSKQIKIKFSMAAQWKEILDVKTKLRKVVGGQGSS